MTALVRPLEHGDGLWWNYGVRLAVVLAFSWLAFGSVASADDQPWMQGVSASDQERASSLVTEANALVSQAPAAALEKYQAALQIWDNPAFRFRMAITLMQLGRDDEARATLQASLRYGAAPFTPDDYAQATSYQEMLEKKLHANDELRYERRFPGWLPWTMIGVSALGLAAGLALEAIAISDENAYDQRLAAACAANGCNVTDPQTPLEKDLAAQRDKAEFRGTAAKITIVSGAAVLVTGIVFAVLNQPRTVRVDAHATAGGATASLGWDF